MLAAMTEILFMHDVPLPTVIEKKQQLVLLATVTTRTQLGSSFHHLG